MIKECTQYLGECFEITKFLINKYPGNNIMRNLKYLSKLHMQFCALLSQQNLHKEALEHAKYSAKYNNIILNHTIKIAESLASHSLEPNIPFGTTKKLYNDLSSLGDMSTSFSGESNKSISELMAIKILPVLYELRAKTIGDNNEKRGANRTQINNTQYQTTWNWKRHKFQTQVQPNQQQLSKPFSIRNFFGFCQTNDWCSNANMSSIMQISPLTLQDILSTTDKELELTRESILEKITLILVAYFCVSTEKKFLSQLNEANGKVYGEQSEFWHAKVLELACHFLPSECPLLGHIFASYQKNYSIVKQTIVI